MSWHTSRRQRWPFLITALGCGGLALLLGVGCNGTDLLPFDNTVIISMTSADTFSPSNVDVQPGDTVKFVNEDSDPHAAIIDPLNVAAGGPNSDGAYPAGVPAGGSYSWHVPDSAASGTEWYFHCRFHGTAGDGDSLGTGMAGVITVE